MDVLCPIKLSRASDVVFGLNAACRINATGCASIKALEASQKDLRRSKRRRRSDDQREFLVDVNVDAMSVTYAERTSYITRSGGSDVHEREVMMESPVAPKVRKKAESVLSPLDPGMRKMRWGQTSREGPRFAVVRSIVDASSLAPSVASLFDDIPPYAVSSSRPEQFQALLMELDILGGYALLDVECPLSGAPICLALRPISRTRAVAFCLRGVAQRVIYGLCSGSALPQRPAKVPVPPTEGAFTFDGGDLAVVSSALPSICQKHHQMAALQLQVPR